MLKKKEKLIGSVILCVLLLLVTVIGYMMSKNNTSGMDEDIFIEKYSKEEKSNVKSDKNSTSKGTETSDSTEKKGILVEIKGAVKKTRCLFNERRQYSKRFNKRSWRSRR